MLTNKTVPVIIICILALCSCVADKPNALTPGALSNYDVLDQHLGKTVKLAGWVLTKHESISLYMSKRELNKRSLSCVEVIPAINKPHGTYVVIDGILETSHCSKGDICLNTCQEYSLRPVAPGSE
jgi:hypothetical protein